MDKEIEEILLEFGGDYYVANEAGSIYADAIEPAKKKLLALLSKATHRAIEDFTKDKLVIGDFKCDIHGKLKSWQIVPECYKCIGDEEREARIDELGKLRVNRQGMIKSSDVSKRMEALNSKPSKGDSDE